MTYVTFAIDLRTCDHVILSLSLSCYSSFRTKVHNTTHTLIHSHTFGDKSKLPVLTWKSRCVCVSCPPLETLFETLPFSTGGAATSESVALPTVSVFCVVELSCVVLCLRLQRCSSSSQLPQTTQHSQPAHALLPSARVKPSTSIWVPKLVSRTLEPFRT